MTIVRTHLYILCCFVFGRYIDVFPLISIVTNTVYQIEPEETSAPECLLCEELVKKVERNIKTDKSKVCIFLGFSLRFRLSIYSFVNKKAKNFQKMFFLNV